MKTFEVTARKTEWVTDTVEANSFDEAGEKFLNDVDGNYEVFSVMDTEEETVEYWF